MLHHCGDKAGGAASEMTRNSRLSLIFVISLDTVEPYGYNLGTDIGPQNRSGTEMPNDGKTPIISNHEPKENGRLDSWKEIAGCLKRDIRTVQLWEKREGLPVHRHTHATRASVFAFSDEIEAWQKARRVQPAPLPSSIAAVPAAPTGQPSFGVLQRHAIALAVFTVFAGVTILLGSAAHQKTRSVRDRGFASD